ncbi:MAG TPA: DUF418 domain-containing protein [Blastocatellia bacterium]|nr:DUF418 domain-containing protein [Blastocatellia bacterium]
MNHTPASPPWAPVSSGERYGDLDVLRGVALLGVLLVNLLTLFRVSLFEHILNFHTHPGLANRAVDILAAWLLEFKAFTLFSFLFGVGVCIQAERARSHTVSASRFLARRFAILLAIGLFHMFLIWNGDILTLYAVCGLLLLPLVGRPVWLLVALGIAAIALTFAPVFGLPFPAEAALRTHAAAATHIYAEGSFTEILALRWRETWQFIAPLLVGSLPKTFGLMLLGIAAWRAGILKNPAQHRSFLWAVCFGAGITGAVSTTLLVRSESTGLPPPVSPSLLQAVSHIPLALAFGAGLLLWLSSTPAGPVRRSFAAAGQMALSNYLAQSIIFSLLFYGFGFGLFGRLGPAVTALIGIVVFAAQLAMSRLWLGRYRFGPAEWLWRSLTYGRRQPLKVKREK